nr:LacI family DNA-binding transcriptional regulator [Shouchella shacheensis]
MAEHLGLSIATVDRVLNNRGNVKRETYEKVIETAEELGYKPNKLARFLSRKTEYRVALVYPKYVKFFWEQVEVGIKSALDELSDYGLRVDTFRTSSPRIPARDVIRKLIDSDNYQGIAIAPGEEDLSDLINDGVARGIKICTFNQDAKKSDRLFYVGANYREAGRLAGELTCKFCGRSGKVAIFGANDDFQTTEKNKGFFEVAEFYPELEVLGPYSLAGPSYSEEQLKYVLQGVSGVYVSTAELGDVAELVSTQSLRDLVMVGHDMNQQMLEYLEEGIVTATINQDPAGQGYFALTNLFQQLAYEGIDGSVEGVDVRLEVIMKENAKFYI